MKKTILRVVLYGVFVLNLILCIGYIIVHQHQINKNKELYQDIAEEVVGDELETLHNIAEEKINSIEQEERTEEVKKNKSYQDSKDGKNKKKNKSKKKSENQTDRKDETEKSNESVFNMKSLKKINPDACGWIDIPNTSVQYPLLRHAKDNTYYLEHNIDGSKGYPGCVYMENINSVTFDDKITVLYAHNMRNGSMFGSLKKWKDASYFENHPYIFIYGEDIKVYKIFAAVTRSNKHLAQNYDYFTEDGAQKLWDDLHKMKKGNFRSIEYTKGDNIIVLSTCEKQWSDKRFLVVAKEMKSK